MKKSGNLANAPQVQFHELADVFPLLSETELNSLTEDIRQHGLREPIVLYQGKVLDGRNRWLACQRLGITPATREFQGDALAALAYVWSANFHRRHLTPSQAAVAQAKREKLCQQYAAQVAEAKAEARQRQKEAGKQGGRGRKKNLPKIIGEGFERHERETDTQLARASGTNPQYLRDARKLVEAAPDLAEKVEVGQLTIPQAKVELQRREKRQELEKKAAAAKKQDSQQWEIICGDCLEVLPKISEKARLIFADPPYNIGVDYGEGSKADRLAPWEYLQWCAQWIRACWDALTDDGSFWLLINHENAAALELIGRGVYQLHSKKKGRPYDSVAYILIEGLLGPTPSVAAEIKALYVRSWITWYETFGVNQANNFNRCSRRLLYFVKNPKRFVFNSTAVMRPSDRQVKYDDKRAAPGGKILDDVWSDIPRLVGTAAERLPDFPTQLPVALVQRIVECGSEPGDLVIDPFCGSASTGVACLRTGRRFLGIEKSPRFADLATKRMQACFAR